jgi:hypothetical protein
LPISAGPSRGGLLSIPYLAAVDTKNEILAVGLAVVTIGIV